MKRVFVILSCVLTLTLELLAEKVYVRGYVLDEQGKGIVAATVQTKTSGGETGGVITNEKGYYEVGMELADSIYLKFSYVGYKTAYKRFRVGDERAYNLQIRLQADTTMIDEVVVKAQARQNSAMQTLDLSGVRVMPGSASGGIEGLLTMMPGVNSTNELSSQYSVRGGNYDENSVYINGIEVYRPLLIRSGQQEGLSIINPDMVGAVNFSSGGFDATYGDKSASVLDVVYRKPKQFEANISASLQGATVFVGASGKNFTQMHGLRFKTVQTLLGTMDTKGEYAPYYGDYQTYMTWQVGKRVDLSFLGNISLNHYKFVPKTRSTSFGTVSDAHSFTVDFRGSEYDIFRTYFGAFGVKYKPVNGVNLGLNVSAFSTDERETYDITGEYSLADIQMGSSTDDDVTDIGIGTFHEHARNRLSATVVNVGHSGEWKKNDNKLSWGLSYQYEMVLDRISEWESRDSSGYSLPYDGQNVNVIYNLYSDVDLKTHRIQMYLQEQYRLFANSGVWNFMAGVRGNWWSWNNEFLVSPRAMITFTPDWEKADFDFRLAGGMYYQAPFYKELRQEVADENGNNNVVLNKHIKAQRTWHAVLGIDYNFRAWGRPFKLTLEGYYKPADRVISYYVDNLKIRYSGINDATAYAAGVDLKLFGEFVPGTDSWIAFSWMRVRENIIGDHYSAYSNTGRYLGEVEPQWISRPNEQRYNISIFFQDYVPNHPEYKVYLKFVWSDGLPFGAPHEERYKAVYRSKAYNRVDIGASRGFIKGREKWFKKNQPVENFWLTLEFLNLFNISNVNSYYWVTDVNDTQYAVPNYLSGFMVNFKVSVGF
ncbi:MAG: carboxypeptidase-like regulatory domain-containing protein [Paludibacteraceae bacterium]|nr:carboxypeptidase-like regulatory domain-containing protein [Paludibacteraceae bacterium]